MIKKLAVVSLMSLTTSASAVEVVIEATNLAGPNGVALSPFFIGLHDGSFDGFDQGVAAGAGIEGIAELGSDTAIAADFAASNPTGVSALLAATSGAFGPGIFLPGATGSITLDLDPSIHRYLTYGSMVVPSNDYFIGNDSPVAIELFDAMGNFTGGDVVVTADQIWNAGTEVDDPADGPAFIMGQDAMAGTSEGGVVTLDEDLSIFADAMTPAGYTFNNLPGAGGPIAQLSASVIPEPASLALAAAAALAACVAGAGMHRRKTVVQR